MPIPREEDGKDSGQWIFLFPVKKFGSGPSGDRKTDGNPEKAVASFVDAGEHR